MNQSADDAEWAHEALLVDAATAAYERARREVFDVGLNERSELLTARQREVLRELADAERALQDHRDRQRP